MALNSLLCADVPLSNYSLTCIAIIQARRVCVCVCVPLLLINY